MTHRTATVATVLLLATLGATPGALAQPATSATPSQAGRDITLSIGEQRSIPAEGIRGYSEGVPGIIDVRIPSDGSRIILVGQRAGSTTLLLTRSNGSTETYQISVFARRPEAVQAEIESLLEGYSGVQIRRVGARLYLEGGVANESQQRRVQQIAALHPGQVESLVTIDPTIVERRINVRLDLYFVDFNANSGHNIGIAWPPFLGGNPRAVQAQFTYNFLRTGAPGMETPPGPLVAQAIITEQPLPRLDIASNGGYGRILRQATLITANGTEATYRNGGEVNFQFNAPNGSATMARIEFGTNLTVTPRFDPQSSRIDVRVNTDISDLVERGFPLPGRDVSHLETLVNLQLGQSIIMSGFRSRQQTTGSSGLPLLRQIPILGYLFGSETSRDFEREGMIFIVPTVVEGMSRTSQDRVAEALRQYEQFSGDLDDVRLFEPTGAQYR